MICVHAVQLSTCTTRRSSPGKKKSEKKRIEDELTRGARGGSKLGAPLTFGSCSYEPRLAFANKKRRREERRKASAREEEAEAAAVARQHSTRLRVQVRARQSVARLPYLLPRFFSPFLASPRSSPPRHTLWPTKSHQTCCNLCCWSPLTASLTNPPPPYRPHRCRRRSLRYVFLLSPSP